MMLDQVSYSSGEDKPAKKVKINSKEELLKKIKADSINWGES